MNWLVKLRDRLFGLDKLQFLIQKLNKGSDDALLFHVRELKAFEILKPYFPKGYLFETGFSISFQAIQHILNDIFIYKPNTVLEFGSGLSTQIISNFLAVNQLKTQLISVDEDKYWQDSLKISNPLVCLLNYPLVSKSPYSWNQNEIWYDVSEDHFLGEKIFDMVIVDAPKGSLCKYSRYGFIPFTLGRLSENAIVYIDDSQRLDESIIVQLTVDCFPSLINVQFNHRYCRLSSAESYQTRPS